MEGWVVSVVELATMRAKAGHADGMADALPAAMSVIAAADGCLGAAALRCIERPDEFVFRVRWVDVAAHEAFRTAPEFPTYRAKFSDHLGEVVGFAHYVEI
jgi:quinol monooxygenase YgiN